MSTPSTTYKLVKSLIQNRTIFTLFGPCMTAFVLLPRAASRPHAGDLYQLLDLDLTEMDTIITNPADKACTEMSLADMLCWLMVSIY